MSAENTKLWFGHPRGLSTLFFTEMWERFSFYGLRALLILYMTAAAAEGGLGFSEAKGGSILGLYTAGVYLLALPGGWLADRLIGPRRSVFIGGVIIAAGHFSLAFGSEASFFVGLVLIVVGTGMLKPNVSTIVGELYPEGGARRDAGFSIFYMGINLGAFAGPLLCGWLRNTTSLGLPGNNWHWAFGLAGVGMVFGLIQYTLTAGHLGDSGHLKQLDPAVRASDLKTFWMAAGGVLAAGVAATWAVQSGRLAPTPEDIALWVGRAIVTIAVAYFLYQFVFGGLSALEKKGLGIIVVLFFASAIFWSGFEQASSSMNLFADRLTDRSIGSFEVSTEALQSVNALFIILLAPVFSVLWQQLGNRDLSIPTKFACGLTILSIGFFVMMWAAANTQGDTVRVGMGWLVAAYFFHTVGELCLSPVGLSSVTKLAPARLVGQMMGIWFMATSLGNLIAGIAGGQFGSMSTFQLFGRVAWFSLAGGVVLAVLSALFLRRWTEEALARSEQGV